jgi:hypothetical protein
MVFEGRVHLNKSRKLNRFRLPIADGSPALRVLPDLAMTLN